MNQVPLIVEPDPDEPEAAEVLVDADVDGRSYRLLLDTGAARTSLPWDEYTRKLAVIESDSTSGVFSEMSQELVQVGRIELGPIRRESFTLVRIEQQGRDRRGVIGMDLLHDYCCAFDFEAAVVEVSKGGGCRHAGRPQELWLDGRHHPYLEVDYNGQTARAVWDTGAGITVVDAAFVERAPELFRATDTSVGTDAAGTERETPMYTMASVALGDIRFPTCRVAAVDLSHVNASIERPMDVILGYNLLRHARWVFDFAERNWSAERG